MNKKKKRMKENLPFSLFSHTDRVTFILVMETAPTKNNNKRPLNALPSLSYLSTKKDTAAPHV